MLISDVTRDQLDEALELANTVFENNLIWNRAPERAGRKWRCTLRVKDSGGPGARRGHTGRRMISACWHAHGAFFASLPEGTNVKAGPHIMHLPEGNWQDWNAGSRLRPVSIASLCECEPSLIRAAHINPRLVPGNARKAALQVAESLNTDPEWQMLALETGGTTYVGSVFALQPSEKYLIPWALDAEPAAARADEVWWETLQESLKPGIDVHLSENDPTDILVTFTDLVSEPKEKENAQAHV